MKSPSRDKPGTTHQTGTNRDRSVLPILFPAKLTREQIRERKYAGTANFERRFEVVEAVVGAPAELVAKLQLWQSHKTQDSYLSDKALDQLFASDPRIAAAYKQGPRDRIAPTILPEEFSRVLKSARLVLWWDWRKKKLRPAVSCPTLKCAQYVAAVLGDLRACPSCDKPFRPDRPDQEYCSIQCRERFRKQRQRANSKLRREKP
jgi:hypothetical protein